MAMIELTKLNGERFVVNAEHIDCVEAQPDTSLVLASGRRFVVREPPAEIIDRTVAYKRKIHFPLTLAAAENPEPGA